MKKFVLSSLSVKLANRLDRLFDFDEVVFG